MTKHLTKRFVDHSDFRFAAQPVSEFALHHAECGFNIGTFVIMLQVFVALKLEVVVHLRPRPASVSPMVRRKRNVRCSAETLDGVRIYPRSVAFVGGNFRNLKMLRRVFYQCGEHLGVARILAVNFYGSDDIRFHSAHEMTLHPVVLLFDNSILVVEPTGEMAGGEARRIDCEINFDRFKRQTAFDNQLVQDGCQTRIIEVVRNTIEMGDLADKSPSLRFSQIAHETTLRNRGVNFEGDTKNCIGKRQGRSARLRGNGNKTRTKISKQDLEFILLMSLRVVADQVHEYSRRPPFDAPNRQVLPRTRKFL